MDELITQLYVYVKGIWKYRLIAVIVAWVVAIAGWIVVLKLPDNYEASARIYVDTQNIIRPLMEGMTVSPNVQQQISIMGRTIISRPNVERIVRMVDLDLQIANEKEKERLVTKLMQEIKLGATTGDNIFTISYNNDNPVLAKDIVQSLLTIFVEEGLDGKKDDSSSALRFIDQQIAAYEEKLIVAENALTEFKQRNIGLLPGQRGDYYTQLLKADEDMKQAQLALREAEKGRDAIRRQISGDEPVFVLEPFALEEESIVNPEIDARIGNLNEKLDNLRLNYTELHPDIVSTKRLIAQLEEQKREEAKRNYSGNKDPGRNYSPMLQQLNVALADAEALVASMAARVEEYTARYERLQSMSTAIPQVEAEFTQLNRDYDVNKANYERLLERRVSARMSGELTSASGLLSFRIIDPPQVPEIPSGPNHRMFFSFVFLAALLVGIAIAFVISQIRPAFYSQNSLREVTGIPVLGSVPMIWTDQQKSQRKQRLFIFSFSILFLALIYAMLLLYFRKIEGIVDMLPFYNLG
ncbi:MAG TPA: GNVR domain-containing protein [Nitrosomonas sp.]|uniref:XrtA system polysaccharide chain length determinant n=1 Tax=Nitrosomonas sp. TaxID=42353 RepID=UPI000E99D6DC|nr:XrtA system polysaccharide chain length determinant [Nitrosomonas sp.]GJL76249.1 MAG: chain-length determining protein [Nitrosomonas sp.]HBV21660.1 chain length-determining protein [Nitrosomonas sp.]HNP25645.1 GNVR domain-containing protein [Nitrosomonas sp.]